MYDGYIADENGNLKKLDFKISEKYAEENEVWVISNNETLPNLISIRNGKLNGRVSGYQEFVNLIQVPNLGAIEGWPAGGLEFKLTAANSISKFFESNLPKISRSYLKNQKWYTLDRFLFRWYPSENGSLVGLSWVELDDGGDESETLSWTVPANNGFPSFT